jgi:predicted transcriptional regulator
VSERISGRDLIILRTTRNIRQSDIARAWPCSRQNIARIESQQRPTPAAVTRYLAALQQAEMAER